MRRVGGVHSCETCCLSMRVGGHVGWYFSVPARIPMGSADAWVQDWWTSVLPIANEPSTNVLGPACAISVGAKPRRPATSLFEDGVVEATAREYPF